MNTASPQDIATLINEQYSSIGASVVSIGKTSLIVQLPTDVVGASDLFVDVAAMNGVIDIERTAGGINLLINILSDGVSDNQPLKKTSHCKTWAILLLFVACLFVGFVVSQIAFQAYPPPRRSYHFDM